MPGSEEQALLELNMWRETWCQVEVEPRQVWDRTQRRHFRSHLRTSQALLTALTGRPQPRPARTERLPPLKLPERKHFEESYKCHLV